MGEALVRAISGRGRRRRLLGLEPVLGRRLAGVHRERGLVVVRERDLARYASAMQFPIIPCNLCGSQEGLQRVQVKKILDEWEARTPGRRQVMFRSLMNVRPSHLADPGLFDFAGLMRGTAAFETNPPQLKDVD